MTAGSQRAALDALSAARPIIARLTTTRNSEDLAADLIEAWTAVETGLRSLLGGSALAGQNLIRELRTRHFLTFEQGNSLAEFHAARERAARTDYTPTEGDVNAARDAFLKLESGLMGDAAPTGPVASAAAATMPVEPVGRRTNFTDAPPNVVPPVAAGRPSWLTPVLSVVALVVVGVLAWWVIMGRSSGSAAYDAGVQAYREHRTEAAAGNFLKATHDTPNDPMPHVYLARMAREANNLGTANAEAVKAVQLGPTNAAALRELASVAFAQHNYEVARTFYTRALQADATDQLSKGYLGCSLLRLGRIEEGKRWIDRAGSGPWTGCVPAPNTVPAPGTAPAAGVVPMTVPR